MSGEHANKLAQFVLASRSPRRREILAGLGLRFEVASISVPEQQAADETPEDYVLRVATDKAIAGWQQQGEAMSLPVLGSDTAVVVDGEALGKPIDFDDSVRMLSLLSGREHEVLTAVVCVQGQRVESAVVATRVSFDHIAPEAMRRYWQTGEPQDKAGSYAIQGLAAVFVRKISGSYSAVVGLPIFETSQLLSRFGVETL